MKVLGVSRGGEFSPNMQSKDAAIFNAVANRLRQGGYMVECCMETELLQWVSKWFDAVFTMARSDDAVALLAKMEEAGSRVVNSSRGIRNAVRRRMTELLLANNVPHPESWIVSAESSVLPDFNAGDSFWIKRADGCAQVREDVCFVSSREQLDSALAAFRGRGIIDLVINRHLEGDLVKFYGVKDSDFFHFYYPSEGGHSKFGLEKINGTPEGYAFSFQSLKRAADHAASVLSLPVYGGDCVVARDGSFQIIDFNDWPSFSCCRDEAAEAIAEYIINGLKR